MWILCVLLGSAMAGDVDLSGHIEVTLSKEDAGILQSKEAWLRTAEGCLPASLADGRVSVPVCGGAINSEPVTCTAQMNVGVEWTGWWHSTCERHDGRGWSVSYGSGHHGIPVLVENTSELAMWRSTYELRASPEAEIRHVWNCKSGEGQRTCNASTGLSVWMVPTQGGRGVGIGSALQPGAIDCSEPCSPNPDLERVKAVNSELNGRVFSAVGPPAAALYPSQAVCEMAPVTRVRIPFDVCVDPDTKPSENGIQ